jgi:hypothetical protein
MVDPSGGDYHPPKPWDGCYLTVGSTDCEKCCLKYGSPFLNPLFGLCVLDCELNSGEKFGCKKDEALLPESEGCKIEIAGYPPIGDFLPCIYHLHR